MNPPHPDSEAALENATIALFAELGYTTANCYHETYGENGTLGRETSTEVVLIPKLRLALEKLNPHLPTEAIHLAIAELTTDRSTLSPANANREIYKLLKDGVKVKFRNSDDDETIETVKVIDWNQPDNNDFFLASQFWVSGDIGNKRADLVGFINGLPLVFIELKAHLKRLELAYRLNLSDYRHTIPQLFWYNAFIILSNGHASRIGSTTASWEHFAEWKKINSEGEEGIISLDTMIRGTCNKRLLLDLVENFTLFSEQKGGLIKLIAKNHQYLGVNNAVAAALQIRNNQGRLGVFWHTQGSGKSYSMQFFSQKILRKLPGNWTFVIVTDRDDLDDQIYKNFALTGAVTEPEPRVRAQSGAHLKQLLQEDHRYVFTLIQKFRTDKGKPYPQLSTRSDIIVIADEAHRSQYDTFALNMRHALPNAAFIGFTGTPLMAGEEEKTRQVFGDYVSIYNFKQSIDDGATVPLFYENRIPEVQLANNDLNQDMENLIEEAALDEEQELKLERQFAREYTIITDNDRLDTIAQDIVTHFLGRGYQGKAMVVSIDRFTALKMYDKVKKCWQQHLENLQSQLATSDPQREQLAAKIQYVQETDMAVVVSQSQNEIAAFQKKGLDITPHRQRIERENLDEKFKDPNNPLRIVFVCAMWITGFDVPSCSTIYLDKPMRNHTLMQTIARANRVFAGKVSGLIVDYVGVFRDLQKALAIYGAASGGGISDETPVQPKAALVEQLRQEVAQTKAFCTERGINLSQIQATAEAFARIKLVSDAVEALLVNDESKQRYLALTRNVTKLYKAILPDPSAREFNSIAHLLTGIAERIRSLTPEVDITHITPAIAELLDDSITAIEYVIRTPNQLIDLSLIDFEALKARFAQGRKRTETEQLKGAIAHQLKQMVRLNKSRINYWERFEHIINEYNAGCHNIETFFSRLVDFAQELNVEDQRAIAQQLTEEELAIFDLLTKPDIALSKKEEQAVKKVASELLETLKQEKLVLDWRKRQQSRAAVKVAIEELLDRLPPSYSLDVYERKCQAVYQHVYDSYYGQGQSIYARAS